MTVRPSLDSSAKPEYALQISNAGAQEIISIRMDGRVFWRGREVETDDDFRAAMMELNQQLLANMRR